MTLHVDVDKLDLSQIFSIKEKDLVNFAGQAFRKNQELVLNPWKSRIRVGKGRKEKKTGEPRKAYKNALKLKTWRWTIRSGMTAIFGPAGREIPHAHLPEFGTQPRIRQPYMRGVRGYGHGIRGKYEFVNWRGSRKHGKPPFDSSNKILKTGASPAFKWRDTSAEAASERYSQAVIRSFNESLESYLKEKMK